MVRLLVDSWHVGICRDMWKSRISERQPRDNRGECRVIFKNCSKIYSLHANYWFNTVGQNRYIYLKFFYFLFWFKNCATIQIISFCLNSVMKKETVIQNILKRYVKICMAILHVYKKFRRGTFANVSVILHIFDSISKW